MTGAPRFPHLSDDSLAERRALLVAEFARPNTRRRVSLAAGSAGALTAAIAAVAAGVFGGAAPAFAGWTATPSPANSARVQSARLACHEASTPTLVAPTLADTRGPYTMLLFVSGGTNRLCITGPALTVRFLGGPASPAPGVSDSIATVATGVSSAGGHPLSFLVARAGTGVTTAVLTLTSGMQVRSTVAHGWLAAWWPGRAFVRSAQLIGRGKTVTQHLEVPHPPVAR
jgi:hypothetical protein